MVRVLAASERRRRRVAARASRRCSPSSAWTTRCGASSTACGATASTQLREGAVARVAHLPHRRRERRRRHGDRRARLPRARAARGHERDDRPRRRLLRLGRPLPRHARRDARRARRGGRAALRGGARARTARWARGRGSRTRAYEYGRVLLHAAARPSAARALLAEAACARRVDRDARAARADPRAGPGRRAGAPRRALGARGRRPAARRPRPARTARSATTLFISEHTAANHVRSILRKTGCANRTEAAAYAYRAAGWSNAEPRA